MKTVLSFRRPNGQAVKGFCAGAALAVLAAGAAMPAHAAEQGLTLSGAWVRSLVLSRPAAGYVTVKNDTDKDRKVVSASSPDCGMLMLHQSTHKNGVDKMMMVESVDVPAHGSVSFAPGGYHLMCMKPGDKVKPGNTIKMTLTFDDGGALTSDFPVRNAKGE